MKTENKHFRLINVIRQERGFNNHSYLISRIYRFVNKIAKEASILV